MKSIKFLILLSCIAMSITLFAQKTNDTINKEEARLILIGKFDGQKNILRWAPEKFPIWRQVNEIGYILERYEIGSSGVKLETKKILTEPPLKPKTIEEFKAKYDPGNSQAALAVQTMYGSTSAPTDPSNPLGGIAEKYTQEQNLFGFGMLIADANPDIAIDMALRYEDDDIKPGVLYYYKLYCDLQDPNFSLDTAFYLVDPRRTINAPEVTTLSAIEGEKQIFLQWDPTENLYPASGYFIEKSLDGGKTFTRVRDLPHVAFKSKAQEKNKGNGLTKFHIKLEDNYIPIQYRVLAFNAFGEVSSTGNIITAMGRDRTAPEQPRMKNPKAFDKSMILEWAVSDTCEQLQGFMVGHSNNSGGPFYAIHDKILPPETRLFTDEDAGSRIENYYIVSAIDTAGNISNSHPVYEKFIDSIPPSKPVGLSATIDSTGKMILTWEKNKEEDLLGYNVWFANQGDHFFNQLNSEPITVDSFSQLLELKTLTETIYYQVMALDINFNPSERSDILEVKKPDIVAPVSPQIHTINTTDKSILIGWYNSPSKDVENHILYRKQSNQNEWREIKIFNLQDSSIFEDTSAISTINYQYQMKSVDDSKLVSAPSNTVNARLNLNSVVNGIENLKGDTNEDSKSINLTWSGPEYDNCRLYIYRTTGTNKMRLYKSIDGREQSFDDTRITDKTQYRYAIKVVYDTGQSSMLSNEVSISL